MKSRKRRTFSAEYKARVVRSCQESGKTPVQVAHEMNLAPSTVRRWVHQATRVGNDGSRPRSEREELVALRQEARALRSERDGLRPRVPDAALRERRSGAEWMGGIISLPLYVSDAESLYRPELLVWMHVDGWFLDTILGKPGELLGAACESLQDAIERPMVGVAHAPARIRVGSPELAKALRAGHPAIEVRCAPTPELDAALAPLIQALEEQGGTELSYLSPGIGPEDVAALFAAAAKLFRVQPWKTVPSGDSLISITIEEFGLRDAVLSVIGQLDECLGWLLFSGLDDFEAYLDAADDIALPEMSAGPPYLAMNFEYGADLEAELREEIAEHGWEIAAPNAYPWLFVMDDEQIARPPMHRELAIATAIAGALAAAFADADAWRSAWARGTCRVHTLCVPTQAGEVELTLRAPYRAAGAAWRPPDDVIAELLALDRQQYGPDPDTRAPLEDALVRQFEASPEALAGPEPQYSGLLMDLAADHFDVTIATLEPSELRALVFEVVPHLVCLAATAARGFIAELRCFYGFLERAYGLEQVDDCLAVLGGNAVETLEQALSDRERFSPMKTIVMAGREAGFDMSTEEGFAAWLRVWQVLPRLSPDGPPSPGEPRPRAQRSAARKRKNKRKAARRARKKNK